MKKFVDISQRMFCTCGDGGGGGGGGNFASNAAECAADIARGRAPVRCSEASAVRSAERRSG